MDGKLLILCDEMPGRHNDGRNDYKIHDCDSLVTPELDSEDLESDKIFMSWEALIPEDRCFIEACKYYIRLTEKPGADFLLRKRGIKDPSKGTLKDSLQERAYYDTYKSMLESLAEMNKRGEDWKSMLYEYAFQYQFEANQQFFNDLSSSLENMGVVRVLPCFSTHSDPNISDYRDKLLKSWNIQNELRRENNLANAGTIEVLPRENYSDFNRILYDKSTEELMEIMSLPYFGREAKSHKYEDSEPEV